MSQDCVVGVSNEDATGVIGLVKSNGSIIELSFDILSLEALFLVPRYNHSRCTHLSDRADMRGTGSARL